MSPSNSTSPTAEPAGTKDFLVAGCRPDFAAVEIKNPARVEWPLRGVFHPGWLDVCGICPAIFWRSRDGNSERLAVGCLAEGGAEEISRYLGSAPTGVRAFGGGRFDPSQNISSIWEPFGAEQFFVPQMEIIREGAALRFALNLPLGPEALRAAEDWIARLTPAFPPQNPDILTRHDTPTFDTWSQNVTKALDGFTEGTLRKVVLARSSEFELDSVIPPFSMAGHLADALPGCFGFCFQPSPHAPAFLGASPERLFKLNGRTLESEAIAGTRRRSLDVVEDGRLGQQLISTLKERHEHALVAEALAASFLELCIESRSGSAPELVKLSRVQHLHTPFVGNLREGLYAHHVLRTLHPTPATCGTPQAEARRFLAEVEPFDRGWYAGPIGWMEADRAEFAVAIRSLLAQGSRMRVFAGAGIVNGSDAEKEWAELDDKIAGTLHAISP
jgi:menaquinone-specific isochorismate synthase